MDINDDNIRNIINTYAFNIKHNNVLKELSQTFINCDCCPNKVNTYIHNFNYCEICNIIMCYDCLNNKLNTTDIICNNCSMNQYIIYEIADKLDRNLDENELEKLFNKFYDYCICYKTYIYNFLIHDFDEYFKYEEINYDVIYGFILSLLFQYNHTEHN
jgi:hypothetical protein